MLRDVVDSFENIRIPRSGFIGVEVAEESEQELEDEGLYFESTPSMTCAVVKNYRNGEEQCDRNASYHC